MRIAVLALVLASCALAACTDASEGDGGAQPARESAASEASAQPAEQAVPASAEPAARPKGRPLPAFEGWTLEGGKLSVTSLIGRRLLLFFFNPEVDEAVTITGAVTGVAALRGEHNFEVVGVAMGSSRDTIEKFVAEQGIDFPVIDDSNTAITRRLGLRSPLGIIGVDAEGYVSFGIAAFTTDDPKVIEANLREVLRLPGIDSGGESRPEAPSFSAAIMDGNGAKFDLAAHKGEPVVLIFFLHTCPHCHEALGFLKEALGSLPEDRRPTLVGVEITGRTHAVRSMLAERSLDYFPVLFDDDGSIRDAYGVFAGVPDTFLIDAEGRITSRVQGWHGERNEPLLKMRLARLAGAPAPMLLRTKGYSGSEVCGVCHEQEHETWTFTTHANAYDTLVTHGADGDDECVSCHVVGFQKPGGFTDALSTPDLEDVGCESCHGRGGPHLSPDFVSDGNYEPACASCHDAKHSLGFDYAAFGPRISHAENAFITALSWEEKQKLLAERGRPGGSLLPGDVAYVGSDACQSCHSAEFSTWEKQPHAGSVHTLAAKDKADDAECLACHTTAFGKPGGFPASGSAESHADLARVGCESCHGPGGNHVAEGSKKVGTIISLGDKCDSCVILQICGSCHDSANDPGFDFSVQEKIDLQRHGTIEPGTGKPKGTTAAAPHADLSDERLLVHAFEQASGAAAAPGS